MLIIININYKDMWLRIGNLIRRFKKAPLMTSQTPQQSCQEIITISLVCKYRSEESFIQNRIYHTYKYIYENIKYIK